MQYKIQSNCGRDNLTRVTVVKARGMRNARNRAFRTFTLRLSPRSQGSATAAAASLRYHCLYRHQQISYAKWFTQYLHNLLIEDLITITRCYRINANSVFFRNWANQTPYFLFLRSGGNSRGWLSLVGSWQVIEFDIEHFLLENNVISTKTYYWVNFGGKRDQFSAVLLIQFFIFAATSSNLLSQQLPYFVLWAMLKAGEYTI